MTLAEVAAAALAKRRADQAAALAADRQALLAEIRTIVSGLTGGQVPAASIQVLHVDLPNRFAVITDPSGVKLAVTREGVVNLVTLVDGQWQRGERIETLAELGEILEDEAG